MKETHIILLCGCYANQPNYNNTSRQVSNTTKIFQIVPQKKSTPFLRVKRAKKLLFKTKKSSQVIQMRYMKNMARETIAQNEHQGYTTHE